MKIYLITKEPFPNGMAAANRIKAFCKAWQRENIDVEVIIYTRTERYGIQPKNTEGHGVCDGIPFRYIHGTPLRESSVFIRQWNDFMDFYRLKKYLAINLKPGDVVYGYSRDLNVTNLIRTIHHAGAGYFNEICEYPFGTGDETSETIRRRKKYESTLLPMVDGVITISDALTEYAKRFCSPEARITKVPILVDYEKYKLDDRSDESPIPYIFHSGTLYEQKDGFVSMVRAFAKAANELPFEVRLISTGKLEGSKHEKEIREIIEQSGISDKVIFTGYLSDDEVKEYLSKARFVVINKLPTQQNKYCFSTKLGEYMAAGKPVLITDVGEAMNWLTHGENAYIVPTGDVESLCGAMAMLFMDKELCRRLGSGAKSVCKSFFSIEANSCKLKDAVGFH